MPQTNYERSPEKWQEITMSHNFCLLMGVAGGFSVLSGFAINYLFTGVSNVYCAQGQVNPMTGGK
jgi:hypothetical protein